MSGRGRDSSNRQEKWRDTDRLCKEKPGYKDIKFGAEDSSQPRKHGASLTLIVAAVLAKTDINRVSATQAETDGETLVCSAARRTQNCDLNLPD